jgi:hypothetical protein
MNRRLIAMVAGGVIVAGGLAGVAAWGSQDPQPQPVTIEVLDRGGHWKVTGAPTWTNDEGDTMVRVRVGQSVTVSNRETVPHWVGPFRVPPGGSITGSFGSARVLLGRCGPDVPETMRLEVVDV